MNTRVGVALSGLVIVCACGSSGSEPGEKPRQCLSAPASVDLTQPEISFNTTVVPIVQRTCSLPACHADEKLSLGIYLPKDPAKIHQAMLAPATSSLKLDFVKAGAPEESFLMHKLDGTHCALDKDCAKGACGQEMPPGELLSVADRDNVRRWIAQGAKNN
ncbi:MAG: hypothetical protein KF819_29130 [Labilithrix sp.]|nr:hypothetical protein [Labilithrix sp.]